MSLYNLLSGYNKNAVKALGILGLSPNDFGRFRDAAITNEGETIQVYTRTGGGNRSDYQEVFDKIKKHPNYVSDYDDEFDCTYAFIIFSVPDEYKEITRGLSDGGIGSLKDRIQSFLDNNPRPPESTPKENER
jgi:hypothetical protein